MIVSTVTFLDSRTGLISVMFLFTTVILYHYSILIPYDYKFWWKAKFGELANYYQTAKYKFRQYWNRLSQSASSLYKKWARSRNLPKNVSNYFCTFPNGYSVRVECITIFHLTWKALSCNRRQMSWYMQGTYTESDNAPARK